MILNPFGELNLVPGTPFLAHDSEIEDLLGLKIEASRRVWTIHMVLRPSNKRALGGVRAKLIDQKGFITFLNQRDLEVTLGVGAPGSICPWLNREYVGPDSPDWIGLCADEEDLRDDLYERELYIRQELPEIPAGLSLRRLIHLDREVDVEETWLFLSDTGTDQDYVHNRWARVERNKVTWTIM